MSELKMTEELRRELAGYLPFSNEATIDYTPEFFLQKSDLGGFKIPDGYRPSFKIRCFNKAEFDKAQKLIDEGRRDKDALRLFDRIEQTKELVRGIICGWRDYYDIGTLAYIDYKADPVGGCDKTLFVKIPDWIIIDLQSYVYKLSGITQGEALSLK